MPTLKKFNPNTGKWEVISTTDADSMVTRSEKVAKFLGNSETESRVSDFLNKAADVLMKHEGNISYLAKNGGQGGGGGGGASTAQGKIVVNGSIKYEGANIQIIRKDDDDLYFSIEQDVMNTWEYTVMFNNTIIKSGNVTSNTIKIAGAGLDKLNYINGAGNLSISCVNGLSIITWRGTIRENSLTLEADDIIQIDYNLVETATVQYRYKGSVTDTYKVFVNGNPYIEGGSQKTVNIVNPNEYYNFLLKVTDIYPDKPLGSNQTTVELVGSNDETIRTSITHQIVITSNEIEISSNTVSADRGNPTMMPKNGSIYFEFIAYLSSGNYMNYDVDFVKDGQTFKALSNIGGRYNVKTIQSIVTSSTFFDTSSLYEMILTVRDAQERTESKTFYIQMTESTNVVLNMPKIPYLLTDLRAFGQLDNNWISVNNEFRTEGSNIGTIEQRMVLHNPNVLTGIPSSREANEPVYFRLSNKAYGSLSDWTISESGKPARPTDFSSLIGKNNGSFTISLCFKADYHSEDDRTIFQLGHLKNVGTSDNPIWDFGDGILINVHSIEIQGSSASDGYYSKELQDNEIYTIDIVYDAQAKQARLYINGVITQAPEVGAFDFEHCIPYFGCAVTPTGEAINFSDVNYYRVLFYNQALTDYDVVVNRIQNESFTTFENGMPSNSVIIDGLKRNFCQRDDSTGQIKSSWLWDNNTGNYDVGQFIVTNQGVSTINPNIADYKDYLPIPILFLDVTTSAKWTFDNFTTKDAIEKSDVVENVSFSYYDSKGSAGIINGVCCIELQGTTTLNDSIKNVKMTMKDTKDSRNTNIFVPKASWLPEEAYTLKADIVDSSHSCNAAIGKFVNEVLANSEEENQWFPLHAETLTQFKASSYYQQAKAQGNVPKMKAAIEGFPVFLIIRFYSPNASLIDIRSLGIYQFILGRDSVHNLGLKVLDSITHESISGETEDVFPNKVPFYQGNCEFNEFDAEAYWIEISDKTPNTASDVNFETQSDEELSKSNGLTGLFWQPDASVLNNYFEIKYNGGVATSPSTVPNFVSLASSIAKLPVCLFNKFDLGTASNVQRVFKPSQYRKLIFENGGYVYKGDSVAIVGQNDFDLDEYLDIPLTYKYLTLCRGLGLADNILKNNPLIYPGYGSDRRFRMTVYDTDSGIGGDNVGELKIPTNADLRGLKNVDKFVTECFGLTDNSIFSGYDNKLWLSLEEQTVANQLSGISNAGNIFSYYWRNFRDYVLTKYRDRYKSFADFFVNEYFIPQTEGCGELLFNLTYKAKYLTAYGGGTNSASKLSGRRIQQVQSWLTDHIDFLDSMASWKATSYPIPGDTNEGNAFKLASFDNYTELPVTYNKTLVIRTTDEGGGTTYPAFCKKNTSTRIRWGSGESKAQAIQKTISWNNFLLKLGDNTLPFGNSGLSYIGGGGPLYGFNTLNLSGCDTFSNSDNNPISFPDNFLNGANSELREIDLSNTSNPSGTANINMNLSAFNKITDINIENSCVGTIALPEVPLTSLHITNSAISNLNLNSQNLLTEVDVTGCNKLGILDINECTNITSILGLNGRTNLTKLIVNNCNKIETLVIQNCPSLIEITVEDCKGISSIKVYNCPNLETFSIAGSTNIESLDISYCQKLNKLSVTGAQNSSAESWYAKLTTLLLSNTNVTKIKYGQADEDNSLDLRPFINLRAFRNDFNSSLTYIRFANRADYAIPLGYRFEQCPNLTRIYGHVAITNGLYTFYSCRKFTIHGDTFNGKPITNRSVYVMPYELVGGKNNSLFISGDNVTNMDFKCGTLDLTFSNTAITQFDVYYVLSNIGTVVSLIRTFGDNGGRFFYRTANIDNSPHRDMFYKCGNVTTMHYPFYASCGSNYRLLSPTVEDDTVTADNGLFSPLVNLVILDWQGQGSYLCDRFIWRRASGNYKISSMNHFAPSFIIKDANSAPYINLSSPYNYLISKDSEGHYNCTTCGNLSEFFNNTPLLSGSINGLLNNIGFVNYDLTKNFKIPSGINSLNAFLHSTYAAGTVNFKDFFSNKSNITHITGSFRTDSSIANYAADVVLEITEDLLEGFTNLQYLGYTTNWISSDIDSATFMGYRKKVILNDEGTFPYKILQPCKNTIRMVSSLFNNAECEYSGNIQLPGTLFAGCRNLQNVDGLFYGFKADYELTSRSFADCTQLNSVQYLFANRADSTVFHLKGSIPKELFYHGQTTVPAIKVLGIDYEPEFDEEGNQIFPNPSSLTPTTIPSYEAVNHNISRMNYCFMRSNTDPYVHTPVTSDYINNSEYMPLLYIYSNGTWSKVTKNNYKQTYIWSYDGVNNPRAGVEFIDNPHDSTAPVAYGTNNGSVEIYSNTTLNFLCAPDLLRYCTTNAVFNGLFAESGINYPYTTWETGALTFKDFGIKGRIPSYLLKPVPLATSINSMFLNCKLISAYKSSGQIYKIPKGFLSYTPKVVDLSSAFSGMCFDYNNDFSGLFTGLQGSLDISYLFHHCYFHTTSAEKAELSGLFTSNTIGNLNHIFSLVLTNDSPTVDSNVPYPRDIYIKFSGMFNPSKVSTAAIGGTYANAHAFSGYNKNTVQFGNKTLPANRYNYTASDGTDM